MQNISLRSSGMRRKQNFEIVFGFKSDTAVLTFTFRFLFSPLFSLFLPHFFFQVNITCFFASFSGVLDWIVLILVWFERSLHSAQVSGQSCPWPLKMMTSQRVERTWIRTGGYRRFRGEWVKDHMSRMSRASDLSELSPAFPSADAWVSTSWNSQAQSLLWIFIGAWLTFPRLYVAVEHDWSVTVIVREGPKTKCGADRVT